MRSPLGARPRAFDVVGGDSGLDAGARPAAAIAADAATESAAPETTVGKGRACLPPAACVA